MRTLDLPIVVSQPSRLAAATTPATKRRKQQQTASSSHFSSSVASLEEESAACTEFLQLLPALQDATGIVFNLASVAGYHIAEVSFAPPCLAFSTSLHLVSSNVCFDPPACVLCVLCDRYRRCTCGVSW